MAQQEAFMGNDRMVKFVVWAVVLGMVLSLVFVVIGSIS